MLEKLVDVSVHEVVIDFALGRKCRADVLLTSLSATFPVAFKVQTSSPHKFLVNPPSGLIPPSSSLALQIVLKPQMHLPSSFPRSPADRFLIRTAELDPDSVESAHPDSVGPWLSSRPTRDVKLKVAFGGRLLLRHAVECGDVDAVRSLIKRQKGIAAELPLKDAESLLRDAAASENSARMVSLLVGAGIKVDSPVESDDRTGYGRGPRGEENHAPLELLSQNGGTTKDDRGRSAIQLAHDKGQHELQNQGEAVLMAARRGDIAGLSSLLHGGATADYRDQYGLAPVHAAAIRGHTEAVGLLLDFGSDVECRDNEGHTPMHLAVECGSVETTEALIDKGANVNAASDSGATPLYIARVMGYQEIVELLLRRGAISSEVVGAPSTSTK
ncbi:ankyrin repeat domain-containing protein 65-like isoform X2 [Rhodamnia argentea]|uniref:Ankyrin repeat domain-containing protein 65-like isoform X2 n=1 Tax=Rhodamnia argentea TaxID=178133 RepID=A0A8B8Q0A1_9MYRT|nr:ankyrin repeat domain-containing protein 65-like isoform X2 [Rhodamnia argentea]